MKTKRIVRTKLNRTLIIHQFYNKLDKLVEWLEKNVGETVDVQISSKRKAR